MLRRNIDLEKGLCNGVLGTVQNIVNGQDGKIVQILVEFDHIPGKNIAIEHVTADYEISPGVYVTRKQFPLCLAYAITIHKSQGISVDGVIADLGPLVFADGMAYVALSRARKLCNVYLIDFDPRTLIMCDESAWQEYNKLRSTTNLPPLAPCRIKPPSMASASCMPNKRSRRMLNVENEKPSEYAPPTKKPTLTTISTLIPTIRLPNKRNACFANSTIQAIAQLPKLFETLLSTPLFSPVVQELTNILKPGDRDVSILRRLIGGRFNDGDQQCAHDFWKNIYLHIPPNAQKLFQFQVHETLKCIKKHENECPRLNDQICTCKHIPGCGVETHKTPEIQTDLTLHPVQGPQQFRTLLVSNDTMIKQCDTCNTNTEHKTTTRREFPPTMHYLVVSINRFHITSGQDAQIHCDLLNFSSKRQQIFSTNFQLQSATVHTLGSTSVGHYTCLIHKDGDKWDEISDTIITKRHSKFPPKLPNIVLLFFQKLQVPTSLQH